MEPVRGDSVCGPKRRIYIITRDCRQRMKIIPLETVPEVPVHRPRGPGKNAANLARDATYFAT